MTLSSLRVWDIEGVHPFAWEPLSLLGSPVVRRTLPPPPRLRFETCCSRRVLARHEQVAHAEISPPRDAGRQTAPSLCTLDPRSSAAGTPATPPLCVPPVRKSHRTRPEPCSPVPPQPRCPLGRGPPCLLHSRAAPPADPGASGRRRTLGPSGWRAGRRGSGRADTAARGPRGHRAGAHSGRAPLAAPPGTGSACGGS